MDTSITLAPAAVDVRWEVVQRVAGSIAFQRSPRLRELLLYICERAIQNRNQELREQQIGCGVFGRKPDYSPGDDNIVRVEVRHLRRRLEEYFSGEGKNEPVVIVIPKGAYVPVFEPREIAAVEVEAEKPAPVPVTPESKFGWQAAAIVILALACIVLFVQNRQAVHSVAAAANPADPSPLWPLLFDRDHETFVVCADSSFVVIQNLVHRPISLEEYLSNDYAALEPKATAADAAILRMAPHWNFTDIADVRLVQRIYGLNAGRWDKVQIRSARTAQLQDFKNGNIILLGSRRSNPWNRLFEPTLNYQFDYDQTARTAFIRNRNPLPGEPTEYRGAPLGASGDTYSTIALVPNLRHTGNVLIVAGTSGEGTETTGEFITNSKTASGLIRTLLERNHGKLPYFEALLKSGALAGVATNAEIVAIRLLPGE